MGGMINDDVRKWIGDLTRTVQADISAATPPEADAVFALLPMPAFPALRELVCGGGTMYNLILADIGVGASPARSTAKRGVGASAAALTSKRKKHACFQLSETQRCSFGDSCKVSNERPAATEARVPAWGEGRGQRGDGIATAGCHGGDWVSHALGPLVGAVRGFGTGHIEVRADAALLAVDRGANSTGWWGQLREGRSQRPRSLVEDCERSFWASRNSRGPLDENVLLIALQGLFHGRQVCMGGTIALEGLNRQSGCVHRE